MPEFQNIGPFFYDNNSREVLNPPRPAIMDERRKTQHLSEHGSATVTTASENNQSPTPKVDPKDDIIQAKPSTRRSLFVRSLPETVTADNLTELFSQNYPLKHATVVLDPATKKSKGYGFVTFVDAEDAKRAKDEFHRYILQGRKIKVEIAEPRHRLDAVKGSDRNGGISSSAEAGTANETKGNKFADARKPPKLIIRNLPWSVKDPDQLAVIFRKFGKVKHVTLPKAKNKDTQAGFAFVVMRGRRNAERALNEVNGSLIDGRVIAVDWAVDKGVWEEYKKAGNTELDHENSDDGNDSDNGKGLNDDNLDGSPRDTDDDMANFMKNHFEELEDEEDDGDGDGENSNLKEGSEEDDDEYSQSLDVEEQTKTGHEKSTLTDNLSTLFIRNLPFTMLDSELKERFMQFGPVRYARVVMDSVTGRPKGTGFVCFFNVEDAENCLRGAPRQQLTEVHAIKKGGSSNFKKSILEDERADESGRYTIHGRVLQIAHAVERNRALALTEEGKKSRDVRDRDKRRLYLLSEGTIGAGTPLYQMLPPSEIKMREESTTQRKKLIQSNPSLHLSLTRLALRNIPKKITSKELKALARTAVVGFAKDIKNGIRTQLSKEEEARGGEDMREAERSRKLKGKGIVKQAKIIFEGREGSKVSEASGAGRSRGYGFIEYSSHRWALMGLRWLNGHQIENEQGKKQRLMVEFAIENAQVVARRKEKEGKARLRSKEVQEAREKGEMPDKGKRELSRDNLMARARKGTKLGGKGGTRDAKSQSRYAMKENKGKGGDMQRGIKRKRDGDIEGGDLPKAKKRPTKASDDKGTKRGSATTAMSTTTKTTMGDDEKLMRRVQIIARKRATRRARRRGGSGSG